MAEQLAQLISFSGDMMDNNEVVLPCFWVTLVAIWICLLAIMIHTTSSARSLKRLVAIMEQPIIVDQYVIEEK